MKSTYYLRIQFYSFGLHGLCGNWETTIRAFPILVLDLARLDELD